MPRGYPSLTREQKQEIISRIKDKGERVADLSKELELGHPECYPNIGELTEAIIQQIYYYNNERIHSALKCPPAVFAQRINFQHKPIFEIFNFNEQINNLTNLTNLTNLIFQPIAEGQVVEKMGT